MDCFNFVTVTWRLQEPRETFEGLISTLRTLRHPYFNLDYYLGGDQIPDEGVFEMVKDFNMISFGSNRTALSFRNFIKDLLMAKDLGIIRRVYFSYGHDLADDLLGESANQMTVLWNMPEYDPNVTAVELDGECVPDHPKIVRKMDLGTKWLICVGNEKYQEVFLINKKAENPLLYFTGDCPLNELIITTEFLEANEEEQRKTSGRSQILLF